MSAQLIDGNRIRAKILRQIERDVASLKERKQGVPGLAIIHVGDDPASIAYARQKEQAAHSLGYAYREHPFEPTVTERELRARISELNRDPAIHGILLQLPLPAHLNADALAAVIDPDKDVEGRHPVNAGRLFQGLAGLRPCTPLGVMRLLDDIGFELAGKRAVIVGRSNIVGKPMAMLLLAAHATATICHRRSDVPAAVSQADLVVAAVGAPRAIKGAWIKHGAVVIDVGIHRIDGELVGDVEFEAAAKRASFITPVPGGVGAVTVAMLMHNTFLAWANRQSSGSEPALASWTEAGPWPTRPASPPLALPIPGVAAVVVA
ncbi:bifunctional 5,10-methylenetetrahydrofolate dehydrogenase/5,10-methenyltetrahydrofolate cyclohydrolase [Methylolobus aquaticus]